MQNREHEHAITARDIEHLIGESPEADAPSTPVQRSGAKRIFGDP
jgi:hypothetical protein